MVVVTNHTIEVSLLELTGIEVHDSLRPYGRPGRSLKEVNALISFYRKKNVETTMPSRPLNSESDPNQNQNSSISYSAKWAMEGRDEDQDRHKGKVLIQTNLHRPNKKSDSQFEFKAYELIVGLSNQNEGIVLGLSALNIGGPVLDMEVDLPLVPVGSKLYKKKSFLSKGGDHNLGFINMKPVSFKSDSDIMYKLNETSRLRAKITVMESTAYLMHKMQMMSQGTISQIVTTRPNSTSTTSTMSQTIFPPDGSPPIRRKLDKKLLPPRRLRSRSRSTSRSRLPPQSNVFDQRQDFDMTLRQGMVNPRMMETQGINYSEMQRSQFLLGEQTGFQQDFPSNFVQDNFVGEGCDYDNMNMKTLADDMTIEEEYLKFEVLSNEDQQRNYNNRDDEGSQLAEFYEDIQNGVVDDGNSFNQVGSSGFDVHVEPQNEEYYRNEVYYMNGQDQHYMNGQGQDNPIVHSGRMRSYMKNQDGHHRQLPRRNSKHRHVQEHDYEGEAFRSNHEVPFPSEVPRPSRGRRGSFRGPPSILPGHGNNPYPQQYHGSDPPRSIRSNQPLPSQDNQMAERQGGNSRSFRPNAPVPLQDNQMAEGQGGDPRSFRSNAPVPLQDNQMAERQGSNPRSFRSNAPAPLQDNQVAELQQMVQTHDFLAKTHHASPPEIDFQSVAPCEDMSDESSESESESESSKSGKEARKDRNTRRINRKRSESSGSDDFIGQIGEFVKDFFGDALDGQVGLRHPQRSGRKQRRKKPPTATTEKQRGGKQASFTALDSPEITQGRGPQGWEQTTKELERNKPASMHQNKSGKGKPKSPEGRGKPKSSGRRGKPKSPGGRGKPKSPGVSGKDRSSETRKVEQEKQKHASKKNKDPRGTSIETVEI